MQKKPHNGSPGTTGSSSAEHFDAHTANIPGVITPDEVIPPGGAPAAEPIETGWKVSELNLIVSLPFFLLKRRYGDTWEIDDDEADAIARAWKPVLDRYLPIEETELGTALLVTAAVLAPRILTTDWDQQGKKENPKKPTPPASTKTAASTASPVSSEKENPANPPEWGVFSKQ